MCRSYIMGVTEMNLLILKVKCNDSFYLHNNDSVEHLDCF